MFSQHLLPHNQHFHCQALCLCKISRWCRNGSMVEIGRGWWRKNLEVFELSSGAPIALRSEDGLPSYSIIFPNGFSVNGAVEIPNHLMLGQYFKWKAEATSNRSHGTLGLNMDRTIHGPSVELSQGSFNLSREETQTDVSLDKKVNVHQ